MNAEKLALMFHEIYEREAPCFGYETRSDTRNFDPGSDNGRLMISVCGQIINEFEANNRRFFFAGFSQGYGAHHEDINRVGELYEKTKHHFDNA